VVLKYQQYINDYNLNSKNNIFQYANIFTNELFKDLYNCYGGVKNKYSRLFFYPERFEDDNFEKMHQKFKLGWFYENSILDEKPLRDIKNKQKIREYFDNHHKVLNHLTNGKLERYKKCTIIDCHSFSNERYWFHENISLLDICIGFEPNHTDDILVEKIKSQFSNYNVEINQPYKGSLVPTNYWNKDFRVKSVMIKINKKLYLQDDNITKNSNFELINHKINNILN